MPCPWGIVLFDLHLIVHVTPERFFHGVFEDMPTIRGELRHRGLNAHSQLLHELCCEFRVPFTNPVQGDEFCLSIDRREDVFESLGRT